MKTYEQRTSTYDHEVACHCDICGERIFDRRTMGDFAQVEILVRKGQSYPEGTNGKEFQPDVCIDCFDSKIAPALESLGLAVTWKDFDF